IAADVDRVAVERVYHLFYRAFLIDRRQRWRDRLLGRIEMLAGQPAPDKSTCAVDLLNRTVRDRGTRPIASVAGQIDVSGNRVSNHHRVSVRQKAEIMVIGRGAHRLHVAHLRGPQLMKLVRLVWVYAEAGPQGLTKGQSIARQRFDVDSA